MLVLGGLSLLLSEELIRIPKVVSIGLTAQTDWHRLEAQTRCL
jgi:hypothetical protein